MSKHKNTDLKAYFLITNYEFFEKGSHVACVDLKFTMKQRLDMNLCTTTGSACFLFKRCYGNFMSVLCGETLSVESQMTTHT